VSPHPVSARVHSCRVASHASPVARRLSPVARRPSPVARRLSPVACRPSPVACRPLPVACRPSPISKILGIDIVTPSALVMIHRDLSYMRIHLAVLCICDACALCALDWSAVTVWKYVLFMVMVASCVYDTCCVYALLCTICVVL
jgi:hypothetical protein